MTERQPSALPVGRASPTQRPPAPLSPRLGTAEQPCSPCHGAERGGTDAADQELQAYNKSPPSDRAMARLTAWDKFPRRGERGAGGRCVGFAIRLGIKIQGAL